MFIEIECKLKPRKKNSYLLEDDDIFRFETKVAVGLEEVLGGCHCAGC
jgi:hypothetical protein